MRRPAPGLRHRSWAATCARPTTAEALTGAGQNLGLLEYVGTDLADLNTYYKNVGQTNNVPITLLSMDGTSTICTDNGPAQLR